MSLQSGSRLGPYEIVGSIGAGGMGEVFRARDPRLARDVAIKVLPGAFAQDTERVARFRREAQVVASITHPNIAAIYGLEESDGVVGLALELVEGEDLAQRLMRGAIPVDEAVAIGRQIAEGLEAAHERGIVHRDLKPANVKITPDGTVKILDFGLAKAHDDDAPSSDGNPANSPTIARPMTGAGTILGTAAYMSPEQARGKPIDKRSDIWSFGVVLYEMLTRRRLFAGETVSDTLAAVLREEVHLHALPPETPPQVRHLLERCLQRDPRQRLRDIGDVRFALAEPGSTAQNPSARVGPLHLAAWIVAVLIAVSSAVAGTWLWARGRAPAPALVTRLAIQLPPGQSLAGNAGPAVSRDGRRIAYVARDVSGVTRLYLRSLDRFEATQVPESEGAQQPFFSPDGTKVAFFARRSLMTASVNGGPPKAIAAASYQPFGGAWGADGTIVYVPTLMSGVLRLPAAGGKPQTLTTPDGAQHGYAHVFPQFLPGGEDIFFNVWGGEKMALRGAALLSLRTREWKRYPFTDAVVWQSLFVPSGHLLGSSEQGLTAIPFELERPDAGREQTLLVEDVFSTPNLSVSWFAASDNGTLVYVPGNPNLGTLAWVDRRGNVTRISDKPSTLVDPVLSPDGTRVVVGQGSMLWLLEMRRQTLTRLTLDGDGHNLNPAWTSDGKRVLWSSNRSGDWELYSAVANGGAATRIVQRPGIQLGVGAAADGTIVFSERTRGAGTDLFLRSPDGNIRPFVVSSSSKICSQFSPDGRAIAYVSDDTGRDQVYVRSVGDPSDVVAVSVDGGTSPRWSPDGQELFFRRGDAFLVAKVSTAGPALTAGDPLKLFDLQAAFGRSTQNPGYSVSPDGQRLLVVLPDARAIPTQIHVALNWFEELRAKVPSP